MTSIKLHLLHIKEHLEELRDAIDYGITKRPATIGFHTSACAIEMLELYLHKLGLIPIGKVIKHDWFKRPLPGQKVKPLIDRKLPVDFPDKEKIYELIYTIEEGRNKLIYGNATKDTIEMVLKAFNQLKEILSEKLREVGVEIE